MRATLLVELLTEELPPGSLAALGREFALRVLEGLAARRLVSPGAQLRSFATPRRLAVQVPEVLSVAPDEEKEIQGPPAGAPAQALEGFARKVGVAPASLEKRRTARGEAYVARVRSPGAELQAVLAQIVESAARSLAAPKLMRWGALDAQFVRPLRGLVMMHGEREVPGTVLGVAASSTTRGHRFMGARSIALASADEYEARLAADGMVIADFGKRRSEIERLLEAEAKRLGAELGEYRPLLEEVAALVEHPSVYAGGFDPAFLEVPQECLILTMRQNQRYFPLFDPGGRLLPRFLIVSNMRLADPRHIVGGNERVVRPRLEDARFFYRQDRRRRLEERVPELARVVYHGRLGSQLERVERIQLLAGRIARELGADAAAAERAAWLAKADLLTGMVGEFPELQGTMGRYYALEDGEPREVAEAIEAHYRPRFAGDRLPEGPIACAVALADRLDALAGLFGIGQQPTGDKDPFGLRRAALGAIRILIEKGLDLRLNDLIGAAFAGHCGRAADARAELEAFFVERLRGYFLEAGYTANEVEAVLSLAPARLHLVPRQLEAVRAFACMPEAPSLAAANKRVANILRQAAAKGESHAHADAEALEEPAEQELYRALRSTVRGASPLLDRGDYTGYLRSLAALKRPVDAFFEQVMVMVEDAKLRRNRLALLADLRKEMNRIADLSKLAA